MLDTAAEGVICKVEGEGRVSGSPHLRMAHISLVSLKGIQLCPSQNKNREGGSQVPNYRPL